MPVWKRQEVQALSWRLIPGGGQGFVPGRIRLSLIQPGAGSNFSHPVAVCPLLKSLHISGYALIDNIDVEFGSGLNIITGETGAGKSILLGALKLILGGRASTDMIRTGVSKAVVEGVFVVDENASVLRLLAEYPNEHFSDLILRRELSDSGSRAFVNDYPVPVSVLKEISSELIDLHGQHDQQSLLRRETHLELLDTFGRHQPLLDSYSRHLAAVRRLDEDVSELRSREAVLRQTEELHGFQLNEIDAVDPRAGEEESLDEELGVLENAEKLRDTAATAYEELYGAEESIHDRLSTIERLVADASRLDGRLRNLAGELRSAGISIDEVAKELASYGDDVASDDARLAEIRERLGQFESLKRKYGGSIEAVLEYRKRIAGSLEETVGLDDAIRSLEQKRSHALDELSLAANKLSAARRKSASEVERKIVDELESLGLQGSRFSVSFDGDVNEDGWVQIEADGKRQTVRAFADGIDRVEFLISANQGEELRSLRKVASGGEVSRIMLALKQILAQRESLPILVFDEIDVGISGAIAQRVAERMAFLARRHQLITITHLPQIAAAGDRHYVVEKEKKGQRTRTGIRLLDPEERAAQVASLISGLEVTEAGLASARELLRSNLN